MSKRKVCIINVGVVILYVEYSLLLLGNSKSYNFVRFLFMILKRIKYFGDKIKNS